jgi:hypothetical protein
MKVVSPPTVQYAGRWFEVTDGVAPLGYAIGYWLVAGAAFIAVGLLTLHLMRRRRRSR